jgi:hypothetical protein
MTTLSSSIISYQPIPNLSFSDQPTFQQGAAPSPLRRALARYGRIKQIFGVE